MTTTPELERAILETRKKLKWTTESSVTEMERTYARALIRELFANLQPPADATCYERDMWEDTLATILRTAGIEPERIYEHNDGN